MKKVVLAYSGGLDTSCAVKWLQDQYGFEVICFCAFIGEVSDKTILQKRAKAAGAWAASWIDKARDSVDMNWLISTAS